MNLTEKIRDGKARVGVVGLGYVGLPLAVELARSGLEVVGLDVNTEKVDAINAGRSYILDVPSESVAELVNAGKLSATTDFSAVAGLDSMNVCVPTPLRKTREPDLSYVVQALASLIEHMHSEQLLVLESTTYPGTTEEIVLPMLVAAGLTPGKDVLVAFSPERTDPGNKLYNTRTIPKVVGGIDPASTEAACALYGRCIDVVVPVSSTRTAEMVKLLENTFRSVNIALANELSMMADRLGIDVWEVIDAAATKPFGFMPFYPGPGLGGHCIPVDPQYLTWKARAEGYEARFIELASQINASKPGFVVTRIIEALNQNSRALKGAKVLALGVAYKRDVDDVRESPSLDVMTLLMAKGAELSFADPFVAQVRLGDETFKASPLDEAAVEAADIVVLLTDHTDFDLAMVTKKAVLIVDTRNAFAAFKGDHIIRL
jgi:UDP-N-acetyl-D-glucosamine dehydrogenase